MLRGGADLRRAAGLLAERLPPQLRPLADVAYNYRWSWTVGGADVFAAIDPGRWERSGRNPVRLLWEASPAALTRAAFDEALVAAIADLAAATTAARFRPPQPGPITPEHPVAFFCAEFGIHTSLPIYSGGLGVLAGDILKQASDSALPMVGVGLLYRTGYFHQRLDVSGFQHEYWTELDPDRVPAALVTGPDGAPLRVTVPVHDEDVVVHVWRVDVGHVPLYLLDSDVPGNSPIARWVTSRLYEGNRELRLAQYAVLGMGGVRVLRALGIEPYVFHLNEGHAALAAVELVGERIAAGAAPIEAWADVGSRLVFTTHTPVAAGNETYDPAELLRVLGRVLERGGDPAAVVALGRLDPADVGAPSGLSTLALRTSRSVNGVSRRHGEVARAMWQSCWPGRSVEDVPITHVTNGVHVPTWLGRPMRKLLDSYLGVGWTDHADDPATWAPVASIPDEELWAVRSEARGRLVDDVRTRSTLQRLRRGEGLVYAEAADHALRPDVLTVGFARRLASYKRIHLIGADPDRALALLDGERPVQLLLAGKAHPQDDGAKRSVQWLFQFKGAPGVAGQVVFLEDYDLDLASELVAGCDLWVNLPRPPLEASGTSGMKAALNGCLNLSVLDGWWAEACDGTNGWAIDGAVDTDDQAQDHRHAQAMLDLLEREVVPRFYDRDDAGIPRAWVALVKRSLQTVGPFVAAARMVRDYAERIYAP